MKLFVAEKPSLGRAIGEVLGAEHTRSGYGECRDDVCVTWVFGHMYEQCMSEDYNPDLKLWRKESLPL
jgi:DNA topoisomerase-3